MLEEKIKVEYLNGRFAEVQKVVPMANVDYCRKGLTVELKGDECPF